MDVARPTELLVVLNSMTSQSKQKSALLQVIRSRTKIANLSVHGGTLLIYIGLIRIIELVPVSRESLYSQFKKCS